MDCPEASGHLSRLPCSVNCEEVGRVLEETQDREEIIERVAAPDIGKA